jgi:hypothetical protein
MEIFKSAEEGAQEVLSGRPVGELRRPPGFDVQLYRNTILQLAWFYSFVMPDPDRALELANRAYSGDPDSANAASLLAYCLAAKGQTDAAQLLVDNYERNQIAELALAKIELAKGRQTAAVEILKAAIARDPGSLEAEEAKELLKEAGIEYIPPIDPGLIMTVLRNEFGERVVPEFMPPNLIVSAQLNLRGNKFAYGSDFEAALVITNNSKEPLVISEKGLFEGNIRIDAHVTGDIEQDIPNLASMRIRPSTPIEPGKNMSVPVRLVTGRLRDILLTYPQASVNINFLLFLDPVVTADGSVRSRLVEMEQPAAVVQRPAVELTTKYLQNRVEALAKGRQGQKVKIGQLFAGLLKEELVFAGRQPLYRFAYADWMPELLKSGLAFNLRDDDWIVRVHATADVLQLPLDYQMTRVVAENLNHTHWPCRLMAVLLLGGSQGDNFRDVLDWTARYDANPLVQRMAVALGGEEPEEEQAAGQASQNKGALQAQ